MQQYLLFFFHGHSCDLGHGCGRASDHDCEHGYKENFKETFYHQKWNNNVTM